MPVGTGPGGVRPGRWRPLIQHPLSNRASSEQDVLLARPPHPPPQVHRVPREPTFGQPIPRPADSVLVDGVVLYRNVVHRRMRTLVRSPRILLLSGSIEYHRTEGRLASMDTLIDQARGPVS